MPVRVSGFRELRAKLNRLSKANFSATVRTRRPVFRGRLLRDAGRQATRRLRRIAGR